jgi:hypothetical protein
MEYVNGLWQEAAINKPRRYNDAYLNEPFAQNVLLTSNNFTGGSWSLIGVTNVPDQSNSPALTLKSSLIYPTVTSTDRRLQGSATILNATVYTVSARVKSAGKQWIAFTDINLGNIVWFDVLNGVLGTVGAGITAKISPDGNGFFLCELASTSTSTLGRFYMLIVNANGTLDITANGTDGVYVFNAQIETGSVATSPIITQGAAKDRLADVPASMSKSFLLGDFTINFADANISVINNSMLFGKNATPNTSYLYFTSAHIYFKSDTGAETFLGNHGLSLNTTYDLTARRLGNVVSWFVNGLPILSVTVDALTFTLNALFVSKDGGGSSNNIRGKFGTVKLYETALTNDEILALNS